MAPDISDDQLLERQREFANQIVTKLNDVLKPGPIAKAVEMILRRLVASGNTLMVLRSASPHDYAFDAASILRTNYDVMLQGLYIMEDSAKQEERANLYLDFMCVERVQRIKLMDSSETDLAKYLSGSPRRPCAEPEIEKQFEDVRAKYTNKKGKPRRDWYPGNLRKLARDTGLEAEYELMQKLLSGVVHSSPLTLKEGPLVRGFNLMDWHWRFAFRILGAYAEYKGCVLDEEERKLIDLARKNVFNCS